MFHYPSYDRNDEEQSLTLLTTSHYTIQTSSSKIKSQMLISYVKDSTFELSHTFEHSVGPWQLHSSPENLFFFKLKLHPGNWTFFLPATSEYAKISKVSKLWLKIFLNIYKFKFMLP